MIKMIIDTIYNGVVTVRDYHYYQMMLRVYLSFYTHQNL
jgi:hypothetical protein